ncbi:putative BamB-like protein [Candidatus Fokinia solitaria]|uniref:Putative BamB-like protein n=1 Tax=Candidatus Fokinia solitaria TaxID=1802984 RepID=A0A2U8BS72_9RICK|nr:PQQ-binding-like beta-propeller repeat protein [Candidatus Fokinia solitaria]AWD33130.1 putative BamB-like protein [Candidatus Fokinia solitaria]
MRKISILLLSILSTVGCGPIEDLMAGSKKPIVGEKISVFSSHGTIDTSSTCDTSEYPTEVLTYQSAINANAKFRWNKGYTTKKFRCFSNIAYPNSGNPITTNSQNVVVIDAHGTIICYSPNGDVIWSNDTLSRSNKQKSNKQILRIGYRAYIGASISYNQSENAVYCTDTFGSFMKVDANKGTTLWYSSYSNPLITTPQFFDDFVITSSLNSELVLFDKNDGKMLLAIPKVEGVVIKEIYNNNIVITPITQDSALIAIQTIANGAIKVYKINIVHTAQGKRFNISTIYSPLVEFFSQDSAIISTRYNEYTQSILQYKTGYIIAKKDGIIEYYDLEQSKILWRKFYHPTTLIAGAGDLGYFIDANNTLLAIKLCNGLIQWKYQLKSAVEVQESIITKIKAIFSTDVIYTHPIVAGNRVVLKNTKNSCLTFDMLTGKLLSVERIPSSFYETPTFQNGAMFLKNSYHILALYPKENVSVSAKK